MDDADQELRDGSYEGDNGEIRVELRIDTGAGIVSGDLFLLRPAGAEYLASVRTDVDVAVAEAS